MFNPEKQYDNPEADIDGVRLREIKDGMFIKRYPSGALKVRAQINDKNQFHGLYEDFHENGQLHIKVNHINGKEEGLYQQFFDNGQLNVECSFLDGKRNGDFRQFNRDGCLEIECSYQDGKKNGPYKQYYKSGQVSLECDFFHGMQISEKSYDENGNKFDAPKGSPEDKKWSKATSQSHRNAVLKEILKAREIGDKNGAMKIAEEFHTKSREKGTIAQMTALKFGKDK